MEMRRRHRITQNLAVAGVLVAALLGLASVASAQPVAYAASKCNIAKEYFTLGPTYAETLNVSGTSCATGIHLIHDYYECGIKAGGAKGLCRSKVLGFSCKAKRSSSPVQYIAKVTCTKGRDDADFTYTNNT
jgi:hypothetical protein